jgi:hypothetical protein
MLLLISSKGAALSKYGFEGNVWNTDDRIRGHKMSEFVYSIIWFMRKSIALD